MKNKKSQISKNTENQNNASKAADGAEVEVLYQRMGDRWFAFSMIEDEVYVGSLTEDQIHGEPTFKITGKA